MSAPLTVVLGLPALAVLIAIGVVGHVVTAADELVRSASRSEHIFETVALQLPGNLRSSGVGPTEVRSRARGLDPAASSR